MVAGYIAGALAFIGQSLWLAVWTESGSDEADGNVNMLVYFGFAMLVLAFAVFRYLLMAFLALAASAFLHDAMVSSVLHAPLSWFDTTPSGRIINRFSRDCRSLDRDVWDNCRQFFDLLFPAMVSLGLVVAVAPVFGLVLPPLFFAFYRVQLYYRASSRELKRLLAVSRSPLYNFFSGVLSPSGLATIRAFRWQEQFATTIHKLSDDNNAVQFVTKVCDRWLGVRFEV